MKNILLIAILLISTIAVGQKNNFYGKTGNQVYKIKIPLKTFNSLDKTKSTIELGSNNEDEEIMVKIFAHYTYKNGVLTLSKITTIRPNKVWNDEQKNDELNKYFDEIVRGFLKNY